MKQRQCRTLERSSRPRTVNIESELITIPKCSTEKMRRKFNSPQQTERCNTDTLSRKSLTTNLTRKALISFIVVSPLTTVILMVNFWFVCNYFRNILITSLTTLNKVGMFNI